MGGNNTGVTTQEDPKQDPKNEKYVRMQKAGLPDGAVRNAMNRDGVTGEDQNRFFKKLLPEPATSTAASPPKPPEVPHEPTASVKITEERILELCAKYPILLENLESRLPNSTLTVKLQGIITDQSELVEIRQGLIDARQIVEKARVEGRLNNLGSSSTSATPVVPSPKPPEVPGKPATSTAAPPHEPVAPTPHKPVAPTVQPKKVVATPAVAELASRFAANATIKATNPIEERIKKAFENLGETALPGLSITSTDGSNKTYTLKHTDNGYYAALQKAAEKEESSEKTRQVTIERQAEEAGEAAKKKAKDESESDEDAEIAATNAKRDAKKELEEKEIKITRKYRDAYVKAKEKVEEVDAELKQKKKEEQERKAASKTPEKKAEEQKEAEATLVFARLITAAFGSVPLASREYEGAQENKQKIAAFKKAYAQAPQDRTAVLNCLKELREALPEDKRKHFEDGAFDKAVTDVQDENAKKAKAKAKGSGTSTPRLGAKKTADPTQVAGESLQKVLAKLTEAHEKYGKYAKMFKIGLPDVAVINAMARDSVSEDEIREAAKGLPDPSTHVAPGTATYTPSAIAPMVATSTGSTPKFADYANFMINQNKLRKNIDQIEAQPIETLANLNKGIKFLDSNGSEVCTHTPSQTPGALYDSSFPAVKDGFQVELVNAQLAAGQYGGGDLILTGITKDNAQDFIAAYDAFRQNNPQSFVIKFDPASEQALRDAHFNLTNAAQLHAQPTSMQTLGPNSEVLGSGRGMMHRLNAGNSATPLSEIAKSPAPQPPTQERPVSPPSPRPNGNRGGGDE